MSKVIGRIVLFDHEKTGKFNEPDFKGYMETEKGKFTVSLWIETGKNTKSGRIIKGQVTKSDEDRAPMCGSNERSE